MRRIRDRFDTLNVSRQRKYQLRKKALGLCHYCGENSDGFSRCNTCYEKRRKYDGNGKRIKRSHRGLDKPSKV